MSSIRKIFIKFNKREEQNQTIEPTIHSPSTSASSESLVPTPSILSSTSLSSFESMRTRSGFQYNIETSDSSSDDEMEQEAGTPSSALVLHGIQPFQPIRSLVLPTNLIQPIEYRGQLTDRSRTFKIKSIRFLKMCGNGFIKLVNGSSSFFGNSSRSTRSNADAKSI